MTDNQKHEIREQVKRLEELKMPKRSINAFVRFMIETMSDGIWDKLIVWYPFGQEKDKVGRVLEVTPHKFKI